MSNISKDGMRVLGFDFARTRDAAEKLRTDIGWIRGAEDSPDLAEVAKSIGNLIDQMDKAWRR